MPQKRKLAVSSTDNYQIFYYSSGYRIATIDTGILRIYIYIYCPIQTFTDSQWFFFKSRQYRAHNAITKKFLDTVSWTLFSFTSFPFETIKPILVFPLLIFHNYYQKYYWNRRKKKKENNISLNKLILDRFEINPNFLFCRDNCEVIEISSHEFVPSRIVTRERYAASRKDNAIFDLINEIK